MAESRSALAEHLHPGRHGAGLHVPDLMLGEAPMGKLLQLSGWPDSFERAGATVMHSLGFAGIGAFGVVQQAGEALAFRCAPERILLHVPSESAAPVVNPTMTPLLDLSHSRTRITVAGGQAGDLLARVVPIDLDVAVFPPGYFVQTGLHGAGVLLHRRMDRFDVYVPRSYAVSVWHTLCENAQGFGYRVGGPAA